MKQIRLVFLVALLGLVYVFSAGMGGDSGAIEKIPEPAKKYTVTLVDQADVTIRLKSFSIKGATFLAGALGKGSYSIGFDRIKDIRFRLVSGQLEAVVNLLDGQSITINADKGAACYGRTDFGAFTIKLGDIRQLTIEH